MNWLILVSDVVFALVAAILSIMGLSTLKAVRHLGVGKAFWIPVFVSSSLFLIGSIVRIFDKFAVGLYSSSTINTDQIVHISWLFALCLLMCSIYSYSRKVKTEAHTRYYEVDSESRPQLLREPRGERKMDKGVPVCHYHLGYLAEIPEDASIPEECVTCPRMLECKNVSILRPR